MKVTIKKPQTFEAAILEVSAGFVIGKMQQ